MSRQLPTRGNGFILSRDLNPKFGRNELNEMKDGGGFHCRHQIADKPLARAGGF